MGDLTKVIDWFIHEYATDKVIKRGIELYEQDRVKYLGYDQKRDTYSFKVRGSKWYEVYIKGLTYNVPTAECTCPYDWGPVCKHSVAALLYLKDHLEKSASNSKTTGGMQEQKVVYRKAKDPVVIKNFKSLKLRDILQYSDTVSKINEVLFGFPYDFRRFVAKDNKVFFYVEARNGQKYEVVCSVEGDDLIVNSNFKGRAALNKLKKVELFVVSYIYRYFDDFLIILDSQKLEKYKAGVMVKYGLSGSNFDDFFELNFGQLGLSTKKKPAAEGLLRVGQDNKIDEIVKHLSEVNNKLVNFVPRSKTDLALGFVIYRSNMKISYKPVLGKPNEQKTRLSSKIEFFDHNSLVVFDLTEEQRRLLSLIELYKKERSGTVEFEKSFALSKEIFNLLLEQPYVLFSTDNLDFAYRVVKKSLMQVELSEFPARAILKVSQDDKLIYLKVYFRIRDRFIPAEKIDRLKSDSMVIFYRGTFYHFSSPKDSYLFQNFSQEVKLARAYKHLLYDRVLKSLSRDYEIVIDDDVFRQETVNLEFKKKQIYLDEKDGHIIFGLQVVYENDIEVPLTRSGDYMSYDSENDVIIRGVRNMELEQDFLEEIESLHPKFKEQKGQKFFYLDYRDFIDKTWFYKFFEYARTHNIEIFGVKKLKSFKYSPYRPHIKASIRSGIDWFDVKIDIRFGKNRVDLLVLRDAIINKLGYVQLDDGSLGILPEDWLQKLEKYFRNATEIEKDELRISKLRFMIIDELFAQVDQEEIVKEIQEKKQRLREFTKIENVKLPTGVKAKLRDYQKAGYNWLHFLHHMGWGGILADDMGLGKTLQVLTFLKSIIEKDRTPNLIIVPTTLLFNWQKEIEKFVPSLKALYHYGPDRQKNTQNFGKYHIIFTTYALLLRDIEWLKDYQFNYVILDESQAIKNPASRRYKAARLLKAKNRIAITGTPIENSTFDLYAQMSFVNPGFFGSIENFKKNYSNPIDIEGNREVATELQKIIKPFVLRRTKEQVASELPPKTEEVIYCEMPPAQRAVYEQYKNFYRQNLLKQVEEEGLNKTRFMVLEALTRLRQVCDSPLLLNDSDVNVSESAKIDEILTHITEKTANHKLLVFSQFTSMLALLRNELDKRGIPYEYLDGKTSISQRKMAVERFQTDSNL